MSLSVADAMHLSTSRQKQNEEVDKKDRTNFGFSNLVKTGYFRRSNFNSLNYKELIRLW